VAPDESEIAKQHQRANAPGHETRMEQPEERTKQTRIRAQQAEDGCVVKSMNFDEIDRSARTGFR
jgi:hypothetical protein